MCLSIKIIYSTKDNYNFYGNLNVLANGKTK